MPAKESSHEISVPLQGEHRNPPEDLTYRQAQAALELALAQLQEADLDVEVMADLYRRALGYAERCETLLEQVEQEVLQWDTEDPDRAPEPFPA